MIKNYKNKFVGMSLVTAMLLGSSAYAGKILGVDAGTPHVLTTPPTQYGFGGWNLDNINVKITDLDFNEISKTFDPANGTYEPMIIGETFESEILDTDTKSIVMGRLHGKNWPVGEPAGIKVVNDDNGTAKSGKSPNCIMTTSYLDEVDSGTGETGYLNIYDINPDGIAVPTICSSPFQSHKRFKINMQPSTVVSTNEYGNPIDLVFNLDQTDTNATVRRYQVFSKINNYTDMRLDGYKVQLLDENGTEVNASNLIKFSLDLVTDPTKESEDESGYEAVFSNGLFGPKDTNPNHVPPHFEEDGFFDNVRAGFKQDGNGSQTVTGGLPTLGSNYEDLFGLWLPSKWAPYGIFWDDDNDTTTDAELVAFWGTTPAEANDTAAVPAWHKGEVDNWALVTAEEYNTWMSDPDALYSIGLIEDTLNLGLNYVVEVGLNSTIGKTFTIRITPHVAAVQTPPSYIDANGDYIGPDAPVSDTNTTTVDDTNTTTAVDDTTTIISSSSGGGGCTYNPNSKNFDMSFLFMMALGLLYPLRRRFIK